MYSYPLLNKKKNSRRFFLFYYCERHKKRDLRHTRTFYFSTHFNVSKSVQCLIYRTVLLHVWWGWSVGKKNSSPWPTLQLCVALCVAATEVKSKKLREWARQRRRKRNTTREIRLEKVKVKCLRCRGVNTKWARQSWRRHTERRRSVSILPTRLLMSRANSNMVCSSGFPCNHSAQQLHQRLFFIYFFCCCCCCNVVTRGG